MNKNFIYLISFAIIGILIASILMFASVSATIQDTNETPTMETVVETTVPTEPSTELETEPSTELETEPPTELVIIYPELTGIVWYSDFRTTSLKEPTTLAGGAEFDIDFFAKLLYAEAGSMDWTGQVYVCSAILNFCDVENVSMWKAGHTTRMFEVAPYVDNVTPTETQYEVIDYVINGGRVMGVTYFRTDHYHGFGTPTCRVENVYFSR